MGILYYIAVAFLISTISLTIFNFQYLYHYNFKEVMYDLSIIGPKKKLSEKESDKIMGKVFLDICLLLAGGMFSVGYLFNESFIAVISLAVICISNFLALIVFEEHATKPKHLINYALKHTDTPEAVLEFKVIAFFFANNEPSYLWDYKRSRGQTYPPNLEKDEKRYRDPEDIKYYFPLFKKLIVLQNLITNDAIPVDSPLINNFILDNMSFLTTILTILQDKKMVETLSSPLGEKDLMELNAEFSELIVVLTDICQFIKKEKVSSNAVKNNIEMLDTLEEIRSINSFSKLIK